MTTPDWSGIRNRVERVLHAEAAAATRDNEASQGRRRYFVPTIEDDFLPPLTTDELADLETYLGITLPEEYRTFLCEVSAGGYGPEGEFFPLLKQDD